MTIPKIIHQIWIGPKTPPIKFMDTWKNKHKNDGFEYIRWTEEEIKKRGFKTQLQHKIDDMSEINGKADILRWEILYEYGGFFTDADAYCIESITPLIETYKAFVGYENERIRNAGWAPIGFYDDVLAPTNPLIATGTMAFPPKHELPKLAIEWIKNNDISVQRLRKRAWRTVGPGLLTRLYWSKKWEDITILPSHYFLPIHASGLEYKGPGKIYAYQEWGSTKESYDNMNYVNLPSQFNKPEQTVNIVISSHDAKAHEIISALQYITRHFDIKIFVKIKWINDNSNIFHTTLLQKYIQEHENKYRFVEFIYSKNNTTLGKEYTINEKNKLNNIAWAVDIRNNIVTNF
jgi:hypothetical protein